jgi:uncharacterized protein YndB with AHSA1/START domain
MVKETTVSQAAPDRLHITRYFNAPTGKVWTAWTDPEMLGAWWAPRPWKAVTVSMDFRPGGSWLYYMEGPEGERHFCRVDFENISEGESFTAKSMFCDEQGNPDQNMPRMHWTNKFTAEGEGTMVTVDIQTDSAAELDAIVQMGFKGGFTMAHGNLDELLAGK